MFVKRLKGHFSASTKTTFQHESAVLKKRKPNALKCDFFSNFYRVDTMPILIYAEQKYLGYKMSLNVIR